MSGPSVHISVPPRSLFQFPPQWNPQPLAPPFIEPSLRTPFPIPENLFRAALDPKVPATIATVYAVTVSLTNAYNRRHGNQPWRISKTRAFYAFVILHNVFLAVYSAVTCVAMFKALKRTLPHYSENNSLVGTVDALCKMHGPRGLGDAVTYVPHDDVWQSDNQAIHLGPDGQPDSTDVGRLWNEGLAFWGWIFYLSKFYEVLDTLIILAKGKRSTTLQTYHHAGAMLCMWAGIRFMSVPIWIFCLVNSGIHAMMYTYYTLSALHFRVPQRVKRTLTTLQIMQFIFGASVAGLHLFISYTAPVLVPFVTSEIVATTASAVTSALPAIDTASSLATAAGTALIKKLIYRAAGEEGLAENVPMSVAGGQPPIHTPAPQNQSVNKVVYRTQYVEKRCIDSTGQSFAVWLNLVYLFPLTVLFVRFFIKSYIRRASASTKNRTLKRRLSKAGQDALHGVNKELESLGNAPEDLNGSTKESKQGGRGRAKKSGSAQFGSESPAERQQKVVDAINKKISDGLAKANLNDKAAAKEVAGEIISRASTPKGKRTASRSNKPDESGAAKEGLSTANPKETGINYAEMAKKGAE